MCICVIYILIGGNCGLMAGSQFHLLITVSSLHVCACVPLLEGTGKKNPQKIIKDLYGCSHVRREVDDHVCRWGAGV